MFRPSLNMSLIHEVLCVTIDILTRRTNMPYLFQSLSEPVGESYAERDEGCDQGSSRLPALPGCLYWSDTTVAGVEGRYVS
jgi:hypothetical protein